MAMLVIEGSTQVGDAGGRDARAGPAARLVGRSGSCVFSIEMLNWNMPVPDVPRTQNEMPL